MTPTLHIDPRPEAMSDVPGVCELPLTRAIVQYRDVHEIEIAGGRIQDIGLALVVEGRYASSAEALDLGSADLKLLDLSAELVVLDWAYEPTLEHARALFGEAALSGDRKALQRFCFRLGLRVLERVGFGPLTRPSLLRIGFRDICRDLDLHEGTSVRIVLGTGRVVRAYLDYDANALVFRTATADRDLELESALADVLPGVDIRLLVPPSPGASGGYQVRFPLGLSLEETGTQLARIREGLLGLLARYEPDRHRAVEGLTRTFGHRETLGQMHMRPAPTRFERLADAAADRSLGREASDRLPGTFGSAAVH